MVDVSLLVQQMHETLSTIHNTIASLSTAEHDSKLDALDQQREAALASLSSRFDLEAEDLARRRKAEREEIAERRRKEDEEREARRRREDEELEGRDRRENSERERKLEDEAKAVEDDVDGQMEAIEEEASRMHEDGRRRLAELEEKRREINRLIDEQLKEPLPTAPKRRRGRGGPNGMAVPSKLPLSTQAVARVQHGNDLKAPEALPLSERDGRVLSDPTEGPTSAADTGETRALLAVVDGNGYNDRHIDGETSVLSRGENLDPGDDEDAHDASPLPIPGIMTHEINELQLSASSLEQYSTTPVEESIREARSLDDDTKGASSLKRSSVGNAPSHDVRHATPPGTEEAPSGQDPGHAPAIPGTMTHGLETNDSSPPDLKSNNSSSGLKLEEGHLPPEAAIGRITEDDSRSSKIDRPQRGTSPLGDTSGAVLSLISGSHAGDEDQDRQPQNSRDLPSDSVEDHHGAMTDGSLPSIDSSTGGSHLHRERLTEDVEKDHVVEPPVSQGYEHQQADTAMINGLGRNIVRGDLKEQTLHQPDPKPLLSGENAVQVAGQAEISTPNHSEGDDAPLHDNHHGSSYLGGQPGDGIANALDDDHPGGPASAKMHYQAEEHSPAGMTGEQLPGAHPPPGLTSSFLLPETGEQNVDSIVANGRIEKGEASDTAVQEFEEHVQATSPDQLSENSNKDVPLKVETAGDVAESVQQPNADNATAEHAQRTASSPAADHRPLGLDIPTPESHLSAIRDESGHTKRTYPDKTIPSQDGSQSERRAEPFAASEQSNREPAFAHEEAAIAPELKLDAAGVDERLGNEIEDDGLELGTTRPDPGGLASHHHIDNEVTLTATSGGDFDVSQKEDALVHIDASHEEHQSPPADEVDTIAEYNSSDEESSVVQDGDRAQVSPGVTGDREMEVQDSIEHPHQESAAQSWHSVDESEPTLHDSSLLNNLEAEAALLSDDNEPQEDGTDTESPAFMTPVQSAGLESTSPPYAEIDGVSLDVEEAPTSPSSFEPERVAAEVENTSTVQGQDDLFDDDSDGHSEYGADSGNGYLEGSSAVVEQVVTHSGFKEHDGPQTAIPAPVDAQMMAPEPYHAEEYVRRLDEPSIEGPLQDQEADETKADIDFVSREETDDGQSTPRLEPLTIEGATEAALSTLEADTSSAQSRGLANSRHNPERPQTPPAQAAQAHEQPPEDPTGADFDAAMFVPRDVTNVPWRARHDSIPQSLHSQTTLSSSPSSPVRSSQALDKHDPVIRDSWSTPLQNHYLSGIGGVAGRPRNDSQSTDYDPYNYDAKYSSPQAPLQQGDPLPSPAIVETGTGSQRNSITTSSPGSLFQKMRNVFENPAGNKISTPGAASPLRDNAGRSRPSSWVFSTTPAKRNSVGSVNRMMDRDEDDGGYDSPGDQRGGFLNEADADVDERSALLSSLN